MNWNEARAELMKDKAVVEEMKKNEPEYQLVRELIRARTDKELTQEQLARLIGTRQTNISRLESGHYNPSMRMLNKIAKAVGKRLEIHLV
jgi:DNA-binding XRE family transcriptional regulator